MATEGSEGIARLCKGIAQIKEAELVAANLALHIAREAVVDELAMILQDEDLEDDPETLYTEAEIDQMARDMVEIYDNDDTRAECWRYAQSKAVENGLKNINRPLGRKLPS